MARRAVLIAGCALAAFAGAFRFTAPPGPGLDPDALSYLGAARSLVADGSLRIPVGPWWSDATSQPLTHFPPGYSVVLAAPIALGADARLAARLVQAAAAGLLTASMLFVLWPAVGAWGAVLGTLAVVLSPAFVAVHLSVLSEPLFLALVAMALWSLAYRPRAAWVHGLLAAAATMVRYAGLSVAGAAALWALRDGSLPWRARLRRALIAVSPSVIAMAAWSLSRERLPDRAAPIRTFAFYGDWAPTLREGARTIGHLVAPSLEWDPVPRLVAGAALVALAVLVWSSTRAHSSSAPAADGGDAGAAQRTLLEAAGVLALAYAALVVASRAFADPDIPFDFRLTAPLVPLAVTGLAIAARRAWSGMVRPSRVLAALALAFWGIAAVRTDTDQVRYALTDGNDFAGSEWRDSPTLAWVRAQDPALALYTNWPSAVWFHLDRPVRDLPDATDDATMREFTDCLHASHGAVVAWNAQSPETAPTDSIAVRAGLVRVATFADGVVYEAPVPVAPPPSPR